MKSSWKWIGIPFKEQERNLNLFLITYLKLHTIGKAKHGNIIVTRNCMNTEKNMWNLQEQ
jgi:hypothetical protein